MGVLTLTRCDLGHSIGALSFVTQLRYVDIKKNVFSISWKCISKGTTCNKNKYDKVNKC